MKTITKEKMKQLVSKGAFLVDMRSPVDYRNAHVSGAVNLPLLNFTNKIMGMPKTTAIVIYSDSSNDAVLSQGVNYAEVMGFTNIHVGTFLEFKE